MENALDLFLRVCKAVLNVIASAALTFMMFLTVADIVCRALGHPLVGTYEVVSLALALVIGFGIPRVSLDKSHVYMEIVLEKLGTKAKAVFNTFTRRHLPLPFPPDRLQPVQRRRRVPRIRRGLSYDQAPLLPDSLRGGGLLLHRMRSLYIADREDLEGPL